MMKKKRACVFLAGAAIVGFFMLAAVTLRAKIERDCERAEQTAPILLQSER